MIDLKTLYENAKRSGDRKDITAYKEAVNTCLHMDPYAYCSNIEYIIKNNNAASTTFREFVETYGIPASCFHTIYECIEEVKRQGDIYSINTDYLTECQALMEEYQKNASTALAMHNYMEYGNKDGTASEQYMKTYFECDGNMDLLLDRFGEMAVPDAITFTINHKGPMDDIFYRISESVAHDDDHKFFHQFLKECAMGHASETCVKALYEHTIEAKVKGIQELILEEYQSNLLSGKPDDVTYYESDVSHMTDYLSFLGYKILYAENASDVYEEMVKLYESLDGIVDENGNMIFEDPSDIIGMLPRATGESAPSTTNKKSGKIPGYLAQNHDIQYGEVDSERHDTSEEEPVVEVDPTEKYQRKSVKEEPTPITIDSNEEEDEPVEVQVPPTSDQAINNYYYYTYNNSLNRNSNSYNKSMRDDHSAGKHMNSHNNNTETHGVIEGEGEESADPFSIDTSFEHITPKQELVLEDGIMDKMKDVAAKATKFASGKIKSILGMKKSIANIQMLDRPDMSTSSPPLTLYGTDIVIDQVGKVKREWAIDKADATKREFMESIESMIYLNESNDLCALEFKPSDRFIVEGGEVTSIDEATHVTLKAGSFKIGDWTIGGPDTKEVIENLTRDLKVQVIFVPASSALVANIGPAAVVSTTIDEIQRLQKEKITTIDLQFMPKGNDKVILVSLGVLALMRIKDKKSLEIIIKHEYGHVLTLHQISNSELQDYTAKRNLIAQLCGAFGIFGTSKLNNANVNYWYHQMRVEDLANKAVGIDCRDLLAATFHVDRNQIDGRVDGINVEYIIKLPPQDRVLIDNFHSGSFAAQNIKNTWNIYQACISNPTYLKRVKKPLLSACSRLEIDPSTIFGSVNTESTSLTEASTVYSGNDPDTDIPQSDHPIKDALTDIDRAVVSGGQKVKKVTRDVANVGRAAVKPFKRGANWISNTIAYWRDRDENKMKEKIADPYSRHNLLNAARWAITNGMLFQAGILLNPIFFGIRMFNHAKKGSTEQRIRNEMVGEIKAEIEILDKKIEQANEEGYRTGDYSARYKLMRQKNEMQKKLIRAGGGKAWKGVV